MSESLVSPAERAAMQQHLDNAHVCHCCTDDEESCYPCRTIWHARRLLAGYTALEREVERMRDALEWIADHDNDMETARTLHYDMRGKAREALGQ